MPPRKKKEATVAADKPAKRKNIDTELKKTILQNANQLISENCTLELGYIAQKLMSMDITVGRNDSGIRVCLDSLTHENLIEIHDYITTCIQNIDTGERLDLEADESKQKKMGNDILLHEQKKNVDDFMSQAVKSQSSKKRLSTQMDFRYRAQIECIPIRTLTNKPAKDL